MSFQAVKHGRSGRDFSVAQAFSPGSKEPRNVSPFRGGDNSKRFAEAPEGGSLFNFLIAGPRRERPGYGNKTN